MDAANLSALPTFASRTPLHIGAVGLIARDIDGMTEFYRGLLGLKVQERTGRVARLGVAGKTLIEIEHRPGAEPDRLTEAGLYHTAFLMPTRQDHARWIMHMVRNRIEISGASDHGVSEAFYLDDPEGNGIEVYSDRPHERWRWEDGLVVMQTERLDVDAMLTEIDPKTATYPSAPDGLRIGHVHLRVGSVETAEQFYRGALGLDLTRRRGGATFMSSGGYHHHVGANVWHSNGARRRDPDRAGLAWFTVEASGEAYEATLARLSDHRVALQAGAGLAEIADPWGTAIRLLRA